MKATPKPASAEKPVREQMLVFGAPDIQQDEIDEVVATLRSGWIGTGPRVARFEHAFAGYKGVAGGVPGAVAVSSCSAALHLSLLASGIGPGDEVITTPLTFCATLNAILHAGATPVLADVDPHTQNLDPEQVERHVTERTRGILLVHFAGRPCDMDRYRALCAQHQLLLFEDCAHAIEATYHGRHAGTFGDFGCFSFYTTKNVITAEGGMVLSNSTEALDRIKTLALHGLTRDAWKRFGDEGYRHYYVTEAGFKYNMTDLQAALGIHQLARVESNWQKRSAIWEHYDAAFDGLRLDLPAPPEPDTRHARHLYTVQVEAERAGLSRDEFLEAMTAQNIGVGVHYQSIPEHPHYQERFGWEPEMWPHAARIGRSTVSLPLGPKLTDADVEDVIAAVRKVLA
ncbi:MAG: DegT/DnrJ/EryC1/StrS family aminotransferase [Planctomycetota bacterium]